MIFLIMTLVLCIDGTNAKASSIADVHSQSHRVIVSPFNTAELPLRINTATAENILGESWIDYSVSNLSGEETRGLYLRVFIADSTGRLIRVRESFSGKRIAAGATQRDRVRTTSALNEQLLSFVAISKVVGKSGVWQVDDSALETAIQSKLKHEPEATLNVTFQSNATITEGDRSQIFELILGDILKDEKKAERLQNQSRVIIIRESVNFDLPQIPRVSVIALDQQEIQEIADKERRVVYLRYEPLSSEGSRVQARIALRDIVARRSGMRVPYKFTFVFTCVKENGRWAIEKSIGYAQS